MGMVSPMLTMGSTEDPLENRGGVHFYPMLLFMALSAITGLQIYNQRVETKRNWISAQGNPGIEFQVDQERGEPLVNNRRPMPSNPDEGGDEPSFDRGFNNPNIEFNIQFKNKIKNNNYEFIVTVQTENLDKKPN